VVLEIGCHSNRVNSKGSVTAGKDADFLVFDTDLFTAEHAGISYVKPSEVYLGGKKMN